MLLHVIESSIPVDCTLNKVVDECIFEDMNNLPAVVFKDMDFQPPNS